MSCLSLFLRAAHTHYSILTLQGNYEDKSDDWIKKEANELQLRAEGKRLNGSAIVGANKEELKAAVIKLRRERQVPPPANVTLEDSMDQGGVQVCMSCLPLVYCVLSLLIIIDHPLSFTKEL